MRRIRFVLVVLAVAATVLCSAASALAGQPQALDTHLAYVGSTDSITANYGRGNYVFDTVEFSGSALAGRAILSVGELERLATDGSLGLGHQGTYSLLTSGAAFSQSAFSGIKLYELLLRLGLDPSAAPSTPVRVYAADGYSVALTVAKVRESDRYNCYAAKGDSTVQEAAVPVLLSYAADACPLVGPTGADPLTRVFGADDGYVAAADNCGGPIRLTVGQTAVDDFNARFNAKWVNRVVVGDETPATHTGDYAPLATSELTVDVYDSANKAVPLTTATYSVADLEALVSSMMNGNYYDDGSGAFYSGVDLWQLLGPMTGLPAYEGTATFSSGSGTEVSVQLPYLRNLGGDYSTYTVAKTATLLDDTAAELTVSGVRPLLALAKNGYPLVSHAGDAGYLASGVAGAVVDNEGGPLAVLLPCDGTRLADPVYVSDVTRISLVLEIPTDVHSGDVYRGLGARQISFTGNGLESPFMLTVADLEQKVELMETHDFGDVPAAAGCKECHPHATSTSPTNCLTCHDMTSVTAIHGNALRCVTFGPTGSFHGIDLLQLLRSSSVGLAVDASYVSVTGSDGTSATFSLEDLQKADAPVLLAFSRGGVPLVSNSTSPGYDAKAGNGGGPIMLVGTLQAVTDVVSVNVSRKPGLWTHASPPYSAYRPRALTVSGSEAAGTTILSLAQLEELPCVRDSFAASKGKGAYQGVVLRGLIQSHLASGVSRPSKITIYGADGYSVELSVGSVLDGIESYYQPGEHRDVILAYSKNGRPLVASSTSEGYVADAFNDDGPAHLIVENAISSWVKDVRAIVLGEGEPVYASDRVAATAVTITSPTVSQTTAYVARGTKLGLRALISPGGSTDDTAWSSSEDSCASVSARGLVTAKADGTALITVRTTSGKADTFAVRVTRRNEATAISLATRLVLAPGRAARIVATLTPGTSTSLVCWQSSNLGIATVDRTGRVVARRAGRAAITVRTSNGKVATCRVIVR